MCIRDRYASASNGRSVFRQNDDRDVEANNPPPVLLLIVRFCLRFDGDSGMR